jgi:3-oxo-5alpha-steroid 4-dehydrogenase
MLVSGMHRNEYLRRDEREVTSWNDECDVLVVGAGCAGTCAAIEAAHAGAKVILLERTGGAGGTSAMSGGLLYLGGGTPIQKACGFEDTAEEMFKYMMAACGPGADAELIEPYCEGSLEHFDWLVARGVPFKSEFFGGAHEPFASDEGLTFSGSEHAHPFNQIASPAPRGHIPQQVKNKGSLLMRQLVAAADVAGVATRVQSRCEALVVASDGRVVGAVVSAENGEACIRARGGVILTAGGFIYNDAMLDQYAPQLKHCRFKVGTENDDGAGIRLGLAAGGEAIRMESGDVSLALFPPNKLREGIFVNRFGQRYLNEDAYMGRAGEFTLLHQGGRGFLIVDDDSFERPDLFPIEVAGVGESIAELEAELELPMGCLQDTVAFYNRHAERGEDPLFHKGANYLRPIAKPPFGAIDLSTESAIYSAFTLGGLRIDAAARVLAPEGAPIQGLFAAGRTTSGIAKQGYSSGMSLGDASFFGRRAGRGAAANR